MVSVVVRRECVVGGGLRSNQRAQPDSPEAAWLRVTMRREGPEISLCYKVAGVVCVCEFHFNSKR